jgi:Lrp/AsnC family leucine-responsive transcriptional regulator
VGYHPDVLEEFCQAVLREPSIVECYLLTGGTDFLLRAVARDVRHLRVLLSSVIGRLPHVRTFESHVILDTVKSDYSVLAADDPDSLR